ncbi:MAG: hypothetical protein N3A54_06685 [Patescibacteria group bacterium]|nr:hypothetical protein [Patescibacteria group bacterium]
MLLGQHKTRRSSTYENHTAYTEKGKTDFGLFFPLIEKLHPRKGFIGGRIGYSKEEVFKWLLVKKVTNWAYRNLSDLTGISHQAFIRRNQQFLEGNVY